MFGFLPYLPTYRRAASIYLDDAAQSVGEAVQTVKTVSKVGIVLGGVLIASIVYKNFKG